MHTNGCEINGMYIVEDISRSVMIENKRKIVTTEFVLVHLSVQLAQSPFDMVTQKKHYNLNQNLKLQNQISILRNLFIMILEWGNTSFYMQFRKNTGA